MMTPQEFINRLCNSVNDGKVDITDFDVSQELKDVGCEDGYTLKEPTGKKTVTIEYK